MNRAPSLVLNTSVFSLCINGGGHAQRHTYFALEVFGTRLFNYHKMSSTPELNIVDTYQLDILFYRRRWHPEQSVQHFLVLDLLILAAFTVAYSVGFLSFLAPVLPQLLQVRHLNLYRLPIFLTVTAFFIRLAKSIVYGCCLIVKSLKNKKQRLSTEYLKKTMLKPVAWLFLAPEILTSAIVIPVVLYSPYGFVASVAGLALCSLLKVIAEGSVLFGFSLLPALGVNIFGYDFKNDSKGALSLLKADVLVQFGAGLPYHYLRLQGHAVATRAM